MTEAHSNESQPSKARSSKPQTEPQAEPQPLEEESVIRQQSGGQRNRRQGRNGR